MLMVLVYKMINAVAEEVTDGGATEM